MTALLFHRTSHGDLYPINLGAIIHDGLRVWDPSYSLAKDPEVWEKAQQDAVISGAIERSLLATSGHSWGLEPFSEDPYDVALAGILEDLIRRTPRFFESRRNLAEARFIGSAFAKVTGSFAREAIHDGKERRWWIPGRLVDIDRRRIRAIAHRNSEADPFFFVWEMYSITRRSWEPIDEKTFPMVRHIHSDNESRLGFGRGVMDSIYYSTYIRSVVQKDGLQGLRRWAQGLLIGKVGVETMGDTSQTNEDIRDGIKTALLEMLGDNVLVIGEGDDVQVVQGGGEGYQMVEQMLDRVERELNTRIEGTPVSGMDGDGGGAHALAKEHGQREHFQRRFDRESLSESVTHGFVKFIFDMNRPTLAEIHPRLARANCPRFDVKDEQYEDPKEAAETGEIMTRTGAPPTKKEYYERTGWKMPAADDAVLQAPEAGGSGGPFGGMEGMLEAAAKRGAEAALKAAGSSTATLRAAFDESRVKRDGGKFATKEGAGAGPVGDGAPVVESPTGRVSESPEDFTREELVGRYKSMRAKPNSMDPFEYEPPPAGTLAANADGELQRFEWVAPSSLVLGESVADVKNRGDFEAYVEWSKAGNTPPPVDVFKSLDGAWKVMNRRRTAAAIESGVERIPAWVEVQDDTGFPVVV